jgi:hypothetical protein
MSHPCQGKEGAFKTRHEDEDAWGDDALAGRSFPRQGDFLAATPVVCFGSDMGEYLQRLTETSGLRCPACLTNLSIKSQYTTAYPAQAILLASLG